MGVSSHDATLFHIGLAQTFVFILLLVVILLGLMLAVAEDLHFVALVVVPC